MLCTSIYTKSRCTSVLIDNPTISFQSFLVHLCSLSATPLFPLTAFCIASLNQPCQVYKYNDKSGSEFEGKCFAPTYSFAETQPWHGNCAKQSNIFHSCSVIWLVETLCLMNNTCVISWKCPRGKAASSLPVEMWCEAGFQCRDRKVIL